MDFIFICPEEQKEFHTADFDVINNKGIKTDESGNRYMDAEVILLNPCPFCSKKHTYHVNELSCPFNG